MNSSKKVGCSSCSHNYNRHNAGMNSTNAYNAWNANAHNANHAAYPNVYNSNTHYGQHNGCNTCDSYKNANSYNANGQEYIVVVLKEDDGPCCTDEWAYYKQDHEVPKRSCCKFNTCQSPCKGKNY